MKLNILIGDCAEVLKTLESNTFDCCVTSPPYYGLRDYGTGAWIGGDPTCSHKRESKKSDKTITGHKNFEEMGGVGDAIYKTVCPKCGAIREDKQVGLEETPEEYVAKLVNIFREVNRVLKPEGTLWLNLGDSYAGSGRGTSKKGIAKGNKQSTNRGSHLGEIQKCPPIKGLKPKDLIGIPWRVAFALQSDGWYLRQDIIWHKPNPMPSSVKDRCTTSHEYIFLLSKSKTYYFDSESIAEEATHEGEYRKFNSPKKIGRCLDSKPSGNEKLDASPVKIESRNKRDVWSIPVHSYRGAHFATFPPDLISPCILAGSPSNGNVLDPFGGSGTTGLVCENLGRNCTLIELNQKYINLIQQRTSLPGFAL